MHTHLSYSCVCYLIELKRCSHLTFCRVASMMLIHFLGALLSDTWQESQESVNNSSAGVPRASFIEWADLDYRKTSFGIWSSTSPQIKQMNTCLSFFCTGNCSINYHPHKASLEGLFLINPESLFWSGDILENTFTDNILADIWIHYNISLELTWALAVYTK